jgi:hypothetical protein
MKKLVLVLVAFVSATSLFAQEKKKLTKADITNRSGDHIMLQLNTDHWAGIPDSIKDHKKGLSRGANIYIMMNKPFKNNPKFSAAFGIGVGTSNMYFKNYNIDIKSTATKLPFTALDSASHFKKYKLTTAYLEIPVELRFTKNPEKSNKSLKAAIGVKVGTLINAHTKGKNLLSSSGAALNSYTAKENSKRYFNTTRLSATARLGYGNYSLSGSYQITALLKDGVGPVINPFQIGFTISGL